MRTSGTGAGSTDGRPGADTGATATRRSRLGGAARTLGRVALGGVLLFAGTGHLTFARREFQAQVPSWVPLDADLVVVASGVVELGAARRSCSRRAACARPSAR